MERVEVQLTLDQAAFVRQTMDTGRLRAEEEAVQEAMPLWEERERRRLEILVAADQAEASLAPGEGRRITTLDGMTQLAADIKRRGMAKLAARQNPRAGASSGFRPRRKPSLTPSGFTSPARAAASILPSAR